MKKRHVIAIALGMILIFGVSLSRTPGAGLVDGNNPHADGIFDNSKDNQGHPIYKITGDIGLAPSPNYSFPHTIYADGVGKVSNIIWMSNIDSARTHGGDYVQNLALTKPKRFITYNFGSPLQTNPVSPSRGEVIDGGPMNVRQVGLMDILSSSNAPRTYVGAVVFQIVALGQLRLGNVEGNQPGSRDPLGSSSLRIERISNDPPTWDVSTNPCPELGDLCGDTAVLVQTQGRKTFYSKYHMPFHMIIKCSTCTLP